MHSAYPPLLYILSLHTYCMYIIIEAKQPWVQANWVQAPLVGLRSVHPLKLRILKAVETQEAVVVGAEDRHRHTPGASARKEVARVVWEGVTRQSDRTPAPQAGWKRRWLNKKRWLVWEGGGPCRYPKNAKKNPAGS